MEKEKMIVQHDLQIVILRTSKILKPLSSVAIIPDLGLRIAPSVLYCWSSIFILGCFQNKVLFEL